MKTTLSLLIFGTFLLTSCSEKQIPEKKFFQTSQVMTGSIRTTDHVIATVEGKISADLSFKTSGRIASVLVKPGDIVKTGQILATLGNEEGSITSGGLSSVLSNLSGISESIDSLYTSRVDNLTNDATKAQIGVQIAEKDLDLARLTLLNSTAIFSGSSLSNIEKVNQSEQNLEYARNNLTNSKKLLEIQGESLRKNALSSMANAFIIARNARDFADETLGVTDINRTKNDSYEIYLGAKDTSKKILSEKSFNVFNTEYEATYAWYYTHIVGKEDISKEILDEGLTRSLTTMEHLRDMLHALSSLLESSIVSSSFSEGDLQGLKTKTTLFLSNLELTILDSFGNGIKGSIANILVFDSSYILKIQQLQDSIRFAEENLNLAKIGKDTSLGDIKKNIDMLVTNISLKEEALRLAKVAISEVEKNRAILQSEGDSKGKEMGAKISETRLNKDLANNSIESGIIRAPFDGVILTRNFDIGSIASPASPLFSMTSKDGKRIKTNIDLTQTPIDIGQNILVSRLSDGVSFDAKVSTLRKEADLIHNKGYIELELTSTGMDVGERVKVYFEKKSTEEKHIDMIIPVSAIIKKYGETGVYILENGKSKYQIISTLGSDGYVTAITGLSIGQKVITKGKDNILDREILE